MVYNIVTSLAICSAFEASKFYKRDLGKSISLGEVNKILNKRVDAEGGILNDGDEFAYLYLQYSKRPLYKKGKIGDTNVYADYHMQNAIIAVYIDKHVYQINYDRDFVKLKGMDSFLNDLLKQATEQHEITLGKPIVVEEVVEVETTSKLVLNPGMVNYKDIEEYLSKKKRMK